jgi:hypothetical protein
MRAYLDAQARYSACLAQVDKRLPSVATPEEIGTIVKFLIAENARMQHEAADLKTRLQASKAQIERLHSTLADRPLPMRRRWACATPSRNSIIGAALMPTSPRRSARRGPWAVPFAW